MGICYSFLCGVWPRLSAQTLASLNKKLEKEYGEFYANLRPITTVHIETWYQLDMDKHYWPCEPVLSSVLSSFDVVFELGDNGGKHDITSDVFHDNYEYVGGEYVRKGLLHKPMPQTPEQLSLRRELAETEPFELPEDTNEPT